MVSVFMMMMTMTATARTLIIVMSMFVVTMTVITGALIVMMSVFMVTVAVGTPIIMVMLLGHVLFTQSSKSRSFFDDEVASNYRGSTTREQQTTFTASSISLSLY